MRRQPKWYRKRTRVYLSSAQVKQVKAARKLRIELGMTLPPEGTLHTGPRGGKYLARGRLCCRACGHLVVRHSPKGGCDVDGCACDEAWRS
jgi:hypothetical protein